MQVMMQTLFAQKNSVENFLLYYFHNILYVPNDLIFFFFFLVI